MTKILSFVFGSCLLLANICSAESFDNMTPESAFDTALHIVEHNPERALNLIRFSANNGFAEAQYQLGYYYSKGEIVNQDYQAALEWYNKSASQNYGPAANNIAFVYAYGKGVEQSQRKALEWLDKAKRYGYVNAERNAEVVKSMFSGPKMFGVTLFTASREQMRSKLPSQGFQPERVSDKYFYDIFHSSNDDGSGLEKLSAGYNGRDKLAVLEFVFNEAHKDGAKFGDLVDMLSKKYGKPSLVRHNGENIWNRPGVDVYLTRSVAPNKIHMIVEVKHAREMMRAQIKKVKVGNLQARLQIK